MAIFEIYLILCFVVGSVFSFEAQQTKTVLSTADDDCTSHDCTYPFDACGGVIRDTNGTLSSPFFPDLYKSNTLCKWEINAPPYFRIRLSFTHFDVEGSDIDCLFDRVDILSKMANNTLVRHGVFCGSELPPVITSEGDSLHIGFISDRSAQKSGFQAQYFFIEHVKSESDLRRKLFENYDKLVRPVLRNSDAISVKVNLVPLKIKSVDTSYKTVGLDALLYLRWEDDYLRWNTSEYNGLHELSISANQVWRPDIVVYNASPDISLFLMELTNVVIHHNGTVTWMPPYSFMANCPPESVLMTRDPYKFDSPYAFNCTLEVGSQTGDVMKVNVAEYERDVKQGMVRDVFKDTHPNWKLESLVAHSERKLRSCCSNAYSLVKFDILLSSMTLIH